MKCPKCGAYIPEGNLYCGKCGTEISFVPEFEPEVENRINESLSGVADHLKEDIFHTKVLFDKDANPESSADYKRVLITGTMAVIIIAIAIVACFLVIHGVNSTKSYEERAQEYYVEGKLDKAIEALSKAVRESKDVTESENLMFKLYGYQMEADYREEAKDTLSELADTELYSEETAILATRELIKLYEEEKDYDSVVEIISSTNLQKIKTEYADYFPVKPEIIPEEGEYDSVIEVTISTDSEGDIYYTVNGSDPDETAIKYEDAVILEEVGDYVIKAVCINKYGLKSDIVTAIYNIDHIGPAAPEILEESGEYSQSTKIVAVCDADCSIYYTTDGSDPTTESTLYVTPITMPIGTSHFRFVTADAEGNLSEIIDRDYHLSYSTLVSVDQARSSIIQILVKLDILLDSTGKMRGEEGYYDYVYDKDIEIEGSGLYYVFVEKHVLNDGSSKDTGLLYAVNTHDGKVNRLGYDSSGKYTLITISNR
ncbi:MAG: zinc-ribbon domain-containing protein [Butyrivibrio sp.]|nr:zinc-ribbon domain-containing protein [Butyrivibrio sp.]